VALTGKQKLFVEYYVGEAVFNATKAAKLAGYGTTPLAIRRAGCDNLRVPEIRAAIDAAMAAKVATGKVMGADEVLAELSAVARIPADGDSKDVKNKVAALTTLAKYHGLLVDRIDHTTKGQALNFAALVQLAIDEQSEGSTDNPEPKQE
jgi:phage terminase small subunit